MLCLSYDVKRYKIWRGNMNRAILKSKAKEQLRGRWGMAVLAVLVHFLIGSVVGGIPFAGMVLSPILVFGLSYYFLKLSRNEETDIGDLFIGFNNFVNIFLAGLLMGLFIFFWSLLFIIPGIIAGIRYSFTYYILIDNPEMSAMDAINKSKEMTNGRKWDIFVLKLSYIGWALLVPFTCAIGGLWLMTYQQTTFANYYDQVKAEQTSQYINSNPYQN